MRVYLPNSAFLGNIDPFLRSMDFSHPDTLIVEANTKWISVHPMVLCMVAALGCEVAADHVSCPTFEAKSGHYFTRMRLFDFVRAAPQKDIVEHDATGRFIPLTQITDRNSIQSVIAECVPLLHLSPQQAEPIRYVLSEMMRNVFEHAQSPLGLIFCAQYYPKSNAIRIGIVDRGVGIYETIQAVHPMRNDIDAIRAALTPGITGVTRRIGGDDYNAGAGLFFTKSIAASNGSFFVVYSGKAMYKLLKAPIKSRLKHTDPFDDPHSKGNDFPAWKGTAIGIDISLEQTDAFDVLLRKLGSLYTKAVKEQKKVYYKAKFI
jgi:anti-sigma regulatory factor (Ser/Thr protein kinase)